MFAPSLLQFSRRWLHSETRVLFILTVVVGCLSGLAAVAFHLSIDVLNDRLLMPLVSAPLLRRVVFIPLLLVVVGLAVGLLLEKVVPFARGSGIPEVKMNGPAACLPSTA